MAVARALGLRVVAEGVETPEQRERLAALGAAEMQGFLFARPSEPDAVANFMRNAQAGPV